VALISERLKLFQLAIHKSDIEYTPKEVPKLLEHQEYQAGLVFFRQTFPTTRMEKESLLEWLHNLTSKLIPKTKAKAV
jgi:hypothetical protein